MFVFAKVRLELECFRAAKTYKVPFSRVDQFEVDSQIASLRRVVAASREFTLVFYLVWIVPSLVSFQVGETAEEFTTPRGIAWVLHGAHRWKVEHKQGTIDDGCREGVAEQVQYR